MTLLGSNFNRQRLSLDKIIPYAKDLVNRKIVRCVRIRVIAG